MSKIIKMKKTLFIADDSTIVLKSLIDAFSEDSSLDIVGTAESIKEAIESIRKLRPDIVILDFQFKEGTGIEILKYIRKNKYKSTVFIFTNFGYPELRELCYKEGADFFFKKLGESVKLIEEIRKISLQ